MSDDLVRSHGYLTLGSRLKRIGERMQSDVQRMSAAQGFELHGSLWTMLMAIEAGGAVSVGELAQSLGIAQPGVTRSLAQLESRGLVRRLEPGKDQRVKRVALTEQGQAVVDQSRRVLWPLVIRAVRDVCDGLEGSFLEQLAQIEDALARQPLDRRTKTEDAS